jgi:hypothetical protein
MVRFPPKLRHDSSGRSGDFSAFPPGSHWPSSTELVHHLNAAINPLGNVADYSVNSMSIINLQQSTSAFPTREASSGMNPHSQSEQANEHHGSYYGISSITYGSA